MQMKTNKNGVKLLATIMVLALSITGFVIVADASDAEGTTEVTTVDSIDALVTAINTTGASNVKLKAGEYSIDKPIKITGSANIDLSGCTITQTVANHIILLVGNSIDVSITGGSIKCSTQSANGYSAVYVAENNTFTATDMTINTAEFGVSAWNNTAVDLNNCAITAGYSAFSGNGTQSAITVSITGGTYTSTTTAAIYFPSTETLTINGGTFVGKTGIDIRAGTVVVNDATININQTGTVDSTGSSGPSSQGMGITVRDHESYAFTTVDTTKVYSKINVTVNNVTIDGAVYDYYIGDSNLKSGSAGAGQFNTDKLTETLTTYHDVSMTIGALTIEVDAGTNYRLVIDSATDDSLTFKEGSIVDCRISTTDGENSAVFSAVKAESGITVSQGSLIIKGDFVTNTGSTITVIGGTAKLVADIPANMTVRIEQGATLEVESDVSIENNGKIVNEGTLLNNGTIVNKTGASIEGDVEGNTPADNTTANTLILKNYNGNYAFAPVGGYTTVILYGDNVISVKDVETALKLGAGATIKSVEGSGTLTIIMDITGLKPQDDDLINVAAISATSGLTIEGVDITISIVSGSKTDYTSVVGIDAGTSAFNVTSADVVIEACVTDYSETVTGVKAGTITLNSSTLDVEAGKVGIDATSIEMTSSTVKVIASDVAIKANIDAKIKSTVSAEALGSNKGVLSYGIIGSLTAASDSQITAKGMKVTGGTNNGKIVNNGDAIITGTFTNKSVFVNNGTLSITGSLMNAAGTFTNNGEVTVSAFEEIVLDDQETSIATIDGITRDSGNQNYVTKIDFTKVTIAADGTVYADADVTIKNISGVIKVSGIAVLSGTDLVSFNASFDNANGYGTIYVSKVTVSETTTWQVNSTGVVKVTGGEPAVTTEYGINAVSKVNYSPVELADESGATLSVTGGEFVNNDTLVIESDRLAAVGSGMNIVNGGKLINNGTMDVAEDIEVSNGKLVGDFSLAESMKVTVGAKGILDSKITYSGTYKKATAPLVPIAFVNTIDAEVTASGNIVFTAEAGTNAPGYFTVTGLNNLVNGSIITVSVGELEITNQTVPAGATLDVASGATLTLKVTNTVNGALIAEDGSKINMSVPGITETYDYGTIQSDIQFQKDGSTYYSNLAYALNNAVSGMELTVTKTTTIDDDTVVKDGITLVIGKGYAVTLVTAKTLSMGEGSSFVLQDGASVVFDSSVVTGTFAYGTNVIGLDAAKITGTISTQKSTSKLVEAITVNGTPAAEVVSGKFIAVAGNVDGKLKIYKETVENVTKVASLDIATDATSYLLITDDAKSVTTVAGILVIEDDGAAINGKVTGNGKIIIKDGKSLTFNGKAVADILIGNGTDGFQMSGVSAVKADSTAEITEADVLKVSAVAKVGKVAAYVSLEEQITVGEATAVGNTAFGTITINQDATVIVPEDATLSVINGKIADSKGLLKVAGTLNMKATGVTSYGELKFEISFEKDGYTVYTGVINGIAYADAGDVINIADYTVKTTDKELLIPAGVSIVIDGTITVQDNARIVIGSPENTLGATGSLVGEIKLVGNAYILAYNVAGVDLESAEITYNGKAAADIEFNVLNDLYATAYIGGTTVATLFDAVNPVVDGYRFVKWTDVDGEAFTDDELNDKATEDFYAKMAPNQVQVTFTYVDGIIYYVDGKQQNIVGAPVYVDYNAIVTAGKLAGYEGTPLVNGETYVTVTGKMTITGSFSVSPVTPTYNVYLVNGTEVTVQNIKDGETAVEPTVPVKDGYKFVGWFNGDVAYDFTAPVTQDIVLVAVFEQIIPEPEVPTPSTGFDVYAKAVDGKLSIRVISQDGYIEDGTITITLSYTYYNDFAGDYMTKTEKVTVDYTSDEESTDYTYELDVPTDKAYYAASATFVSGDLKDETGTIFI